MQLNISDAKNTFRVFAASVVILSLFASVNTVSAGTMLWDTMVKETDCSKLPNNYSNSACWSYEMTSSKSWKNKANWTPAGQPDYTFVGNALVETDTYYYLFHTGMGDGPFYWQKYPSGVLQGKHFGAEQYGTATGMGTPSKVSNYHLNSVRIIKNIDDEIVLKVDAGGWGSGIIPNKNIVFYTFKNNLFEITPVNNYTYSSTLHSATARIVVLVANDKSGNDTLVDINYDNTGKDLESFYPPSTNKRFMIQLSSMKANDPKYNVMYMAIPKDYASAKTYVSGGIRRGFPTIEIFGGYNISGSNNNSAMYFSNLPYENVWKLYEPNVIIDAGETYTAPWIPTIPGKYRMTGLVLSAGKKIYITKDVSNGNFVFTSPVKGNLLDIAIYLYDRIDSTPSNIMTPMDIYRKSISKISTPSTPVFSPPAGAYTSEQTVQITTATAGAIIRYTTDGSIPTETSAVYATPIGININSTITLKAKAWMSGMTPSGAATATYTIYTPIISSITVSPAQASMIVNSTQAFVANPKDQFGNPITATVTWTSSNESVGTITPDGVFTALAERTTTIIATNKTVTGVANVTITAFQPTENIITNPGFESGKTSWTFYTNAAGATFNAVPPGYERNYSAKLAFSKPGTNMQLYQSGIHLEPNTVYRLSFAAYSTTGHDVTLKLLKSVSPFTSYGLAQTFNLGMSWQDFTTEFTTKGFSGTVNDGRLQFWLVPFAKAGDTYYIDDVRWEKVSDSAGLPGITTHPSDQTVMEGQAATFSAAATGASLSYQWQKNGVNISGVKIATYITPSATLADNGAIFRVIISNAAGSVMSNNATLTVLPAVSTNIINNPGFESGKTSWTFYTNAAGPMFNAAPPGYEEDNSAKLTFSKVGTNMQLYQSGITLEPNTRYRLTFSAYSSTGHDVSITIQKHISPYTNYGLSKYTANLNNSWTEYSTEFTTANIPNSVTDARLMFWFTGFATTGDTYYFDNIQLSRLI